MNIKDYEFHVGDEVITTEGEKGKIIDICTCEKCEERGFYEPFWVDENDNQEHCISKFTAEFGFSGYYKIGNYRFNDFDKGDVLRNIAYCEDELKRFRKQLKLIEELENQY